jgi:hypothetical protein
MKIVGSFFAFFVITLSLINCTSTRNVYRLYAAVRINDSAYFDETEVDVRSWLSFYTWTLEHQGVTEALKLLPDSNSIDSQIWQLIRKKSHVYNTNICGLTGQPIGFFENNCENCTNCDMELAPYHGCPLLVFPITGLSYEQVIAFCSWRTKLQVDGKITIRLPSEKEWKDFALSGLIEKERMQGFKDSSCTEPCQMYNYKINSSLESHLHAVGRFSPDKNKAFDVFGNVSEMTNVKGVSKGGNYLLYANQCHPDSIQKYERPEKWLGFRCIRIIKK